MQGWKNLVFLEKVFSFLRFLGFSVQDRPDTKYDPGRTYIHYSPWQVASVNYNETHKSRLKYEIKCSYVEKIKKETLKNLKRRLLRFLK